MENEGVIQILANLYPEFIPAEAYEDIVNLVVAQVRSDMFRKMTLKDGKWVAADGTVAPDVSKIAEIVEHRQPPANGIRGGGRRYDLPSDSQVKALHAEDASKYPSIRAVSEKVQRDIRSGALRVDDRVLHGAPAIEMPGPNGSKTLVPRYAVPENELRRQDQADADRTAKQFQYSGEPTSVQVGTPKPAQVPHWEKPVSFNDVLMGPSMPKPQGR